MGIQEILTESIIHRGGLAECLLRMGKLDGGGRIRARLEVFFFFFSDRLSGSIYHIYRALPINSSPQTAIPLCKQTKSPNHSFIYLVEYHVPATSDTGRKPLYLSFMTFCYRNSLNPLSGCRPPFRGELRRRWTQVSYLRDTTLPSSSLYLPPGQAPPLSLSLCAFVTICMYIYIYIYIYI